MNPEHDIAATREKSAFRLAGSFLLPTSGEAGRADGCWKRAGAWLPLWGLLIGAAYAGLFRGLWLWLGEYQHIRAAPMAVLLAFDACYLGYRLLAGAAAVVQGWSGRSTFAGPAACVTLAAVVFLIVAVILKFSLLVALPAGAVTWPADWRQNLRFLYPYVIYRPLVLMPLWGRWGVYLAGGIGRVAPGSPAGFTQLAGGTRLSGVMGWWVGISALTVMYACPATGHIGWAMLICLAMLVVAYLASFTLALRFGGQTEATVAAVGWAVEIAFLLAYLPVARSIYWY